MPSKPGDKSPEDLIGSLKSGFYVTEVFGQGVDMVTGEYSRGASGFWIENGELAYPVSEVTIASNLKDMFLGWFRQATSTAISAPPPDAADRRDDPCRQLKPVHQADLRGDLELLREAGREAGQIALRYFSKSPRSVDEGRHLAGQRSRLCGGQVSARNPAGGQAGLWLAVGRDR